MPMRFRPLAVVCFAFAALPVPRAAAETYKLVTLDYPPLEFADDHGKATGAAVIIAPGGGHMFLTIDREGYDLGKWLADHGVAAFVLKYRLARDQAGNSPYKVEVDALADAKRSMRLVRSRAGEWGIDPNRLGMVGFSAGGEVISMTAFGDTAGITNAPDPIDQANARPDYIVEIYPGGGGIPQVLPPNAPPAFLLVADDDDHTTAVLKLFTLYRAAKIPVEVHVFTRGQHAFGMGGHSRLTTIKDWPERLADWMGDNNILNPAVPAQGVK